MLVADYISPGLVRGYARFDPRADRTAIATRPISSAHGHLAMTIDQGPDTERYQGIVALEGEGPEAAAHTYFAQSEQIPTRLALAAGRLCGAAAGGGWRAGAIMVQHLPADGGQSPLPPIQRRGPGSDELSAEDDRWVKARLLLDTVEDHELLDPAAGARTPPLSPLPRGRRQGLFRPWPSSTIAPARASASPKCIARFTAEERADMLENGKITVTCEFCSTRYVFEPDELAAAE